MKSIKLENQEQFNKLKKGDVVVVQWKKDSWAYKQYGEITHHNIWGINEADELILNFRRNIYFDVEYFLQGRSYAKEVYLMTV